MAHNNPGYMLVYTLVWKQGLVRPHQYLDAC